MLKRFIILWMALAYSLSFAHSVVPHVHRDEAAKVHSHQHDTHSHHHHHDDGNDDVTLSHFFADVIHHPSGSFLIHNQASENVPKIKAFAQFSLLASDLVLPPKSEPPDCNSSYRSIHYSLRLLSTSLLRAPPAI